MKVNKTEIGKNNTQNLEKALSSLHRDHQQALELCRVIREGIRQDIAPQRIKDYADWYYKNELAPHFEIENEYIFPILGVESELVKKVLTQQRKLKKSFTQNIEVKKSLNRIEEGLEELIRFEEKNIFTAIRNNVPSHQLLPIMEVFSRETNSKDWNDYFWQ